MLESTQSQEREPFARCSKAHKNKSEAVSKMFESTQSQDGEPLASHKVKKGSR